MLTSDQTARSHPALHLGVITAALSKLHLGRGCQLGCGCSGTRHSRSGASRHSSISCPRRLRLFWSLPSRLFVYLSVWDFEKAKALHSAGSAPPFPLPSSALAQPLAQYLLISARFLPAHSLTALCSKINTEPGRFPPYVLAGRN